MAFETVLTEKNDAIGTITLNRPEHFNTFSTRMAEELNAALLQMEADDEVRVVIVTGAGKVFSTGIDISEFPGKNPSEYQAWISLMDQMHMTIAAMGKPVIAMAKKFAVANGAGLLLAADFAVVAEGTQIGTTAINVGLLCTGPIIPVTYAVGKKKSLEMLLSGDMIDAAEAERLGLVNRVVPEADLEKETLAFARKLTQKSPVALRMGKEFYYKMIDMPFAQRFAYNSEVFSRLCTTEDAQEGVSAFIEKRKPEWKGR
ncbi:enoyl-CoA hydratase [Desulfonema ishimotonii]|uniref:Enoyl-CoA hydratase domain-containing protein 3, mitochondrial n=1 Tax=Desulfonema ishimotonii TaxID=45657 RepID=A0A401FVH2_9BACT|nr:enoyl-CoA hydratase-related protein [Desulfonema ishimotonii]GBC60959.1 enoyl-CoA hydratase [Desulfonema ishimotonii]